MTKILVFLLGIICIPVYAVCVLLLIVTGPIFGGYVNASVYVCEYFQPIITGLIAILFMVFVCNYIYGAFQAGGYWRFAIFLLAAILYLAIILICWQQLTTRIADYQGMTNPQIFDYVVNKLQIMGRPFDGLITIKHSKITFGYIVANFVTYILPMLATLVCGLIVRIIAKMHPTV